jgi:hypothetical protein
MRIAEQISRRLVHRFFPNRSIQLLLHERMSMELSTLQDLYTHELKDLYSAERQLIQALPKMAKAATNEQLPPALMSTWKRRKSMPIA